jgi:hypothetical protein
MENCFWENWWNWIQNTVFRVISDWWSDTRQYLLGMGCTSSEDSNPYNPGMRRKNAKSSFQPIPDRYETIGKSFSIQFY